MLRAMKMWRAVVKIWLGFFAFLLLVSSSSTVHVEPLCLEELADLESG
jgi:hypothetical protein